MTTATDPRTAERFDVLLDYTPCGGSLFVKESRLKANGRTEYRTTNVVDARKRGQITQEWPHAQGYGINA